VTGVGFQALMKEILDWFFKANPVMATAVGVHEHDTCLNDVRPEAIAAQHQQGKRYLARLEAIAPESLTPAEAIDKELMEVQVESAIKFEDALHDWRRNPTYADLALFGCYFLLFREFAPLEQRLEATLGRLRGIPALLAQGAANLTEPVRVFVETNLETARGGLGFFLGVVPFFIEQAGSPTLRRDLEQANTKAVEALQDYVASLEALLPSARPEFGLGRELFDYLLRRRHLLPYNADSLYAKGEEIFADTLRQMEETARQIDKTKPVLEVIADLKREHPAPRELLDTYRRHMEASRQWVIDQGLVDIPPGESLIVEETPIFQRPVIPYAAYLAPPAFEADQTGRFWVTPVDETMPKEQQEERIRDHCSYGIPIIAVHEAYPGHHLQLCWANQNPSPMRKLNNSSLLSEGWAFYLEELAEQLGFVCGPKYRLMRLKDQLWRAGRIILDSALHTRGMTVDEAVDFFVDRVHLERPNALAEVRRYTVSATQPMSYLIGKLEILKLAADYKVKKGKDYNMRRFHNDIMAQGNVPPAMVRRILLG
jgi:uncharacterized protein (DUF885 family)